MPEWRQRLPPVFHQCSVLDRCLIVDPISHRSVSDWYVINTQVVPKQVPNQRSIAVQSVLKSGSDQCLIAIQSVSKHFPNRARSVCNRYPISVQSLGTPRRPTRPSHPILSKSHRSITAFSTNSPRHAPSRKADERNLRTLLVKKIQPNLLSSQLWSQYSTSQHIQERSRLQPRGNPASSQPTPDPLARQRLDKAATHRPRPKQELTSTDIAGAGNRLTGSRTPKASRLASPGGMTPPPASKTAGDRRFGARAISA